MVAVVQSGSGAPDEQVAVVRCVQVNDQEPAEFAIAVADRFQAKGLGYALMRELIECARARGWTLLQGVVLWNNHHMLELMHTLGFSVAPSAEDAHLRVATLILDGSGSEKRHGK